MTEYDIFIGREIFDDGLETFVTRPLQGSGVCSYASLIIACEELCNSVREGKSVLLYLAPDQVSPLTRERPGSTESRFESFKPEQMGLLQRLYAQKEEMKRFPDPFDNQPQIH